ncbi:polyketide synthase, partial [Streptomyces xinghaiensis]
MTSNTAAQNTGDQEDVDGPDSTHGGEIAVVGMSCRLPGAAGVEEFWELLRSGRGMPTRQDDGTWRAALEDHAGFDAGFFGMNARQAAATDPQHRLMLELGWEALEDAGIVPGDLTGTDTGVFAGVASDDYAVLTRRSAVSAGGYTATGLHRALAANRLSHFLGLRGPSLVVDSAQSASLVAVQLACESLRRGETSLAVAGGVNLILTEESTTVMERMGALSPDGRCHTFDARANGYVRGEGGGAVVLKPLDAALADGDRVYCVIKGGAVNNDGGGASLTTPDREAQEAVLRQAYRRAGVSTGAVRYVELHGTGTRAGDPVEAAALGAVLGAGADSGRSTPLAVGSVKTNVGHLEGAAGIVGLIKATLCVRKGELVPSLNFSTPNPDIPLDDLRLRVQTERQEWNEEDDRPRVAGVSSFGMGGTNVHLVIAEAPAAAGSSGAGGSGAGSGAGISAVSGVVPVVVSGRSRVVVREAAGRLAEVVEAGGVGLADVAVTMAG